MKANHNSKNYPFLLTVFVASYIVLGVSKSAMAQEQPNQRQRSQGQAEAEDPVQTLNIDQLQQQYWKPKDKEFRVIQNKIFTKRKRVELGAHLGIYQRAEFDESLTPGLFFGYHFDDEYAISSTAYYFINSRNNVTETVKNRNGIDVPYNEEVFYWDLALEWTPIYGKFSLLGQKVSHFDAYIAPSIGVIGTKSTYDAPEAAGDPEIPNPRDVNIFPTIGLGLGQRFFLSKTMMIKLEYQINVYEDDEVWQRNDNLSFPDYRTDQVVDQNILLSFSVLFDFFGAEQEERANLRKANSQP